MPVYEYVCKTHGAFDEVRRIADRDNEIVCPKCGMRAKRKPISGNMRSTILTEDMRDFYGDVLDSITPPWERVPEINTIGDVDAYMRSRGVSRDNIMPTQEWREMTGRPSVEERNGVDLDRRRLLGRR